MNSIHLLLSLFLLVAFSNQHMVYGNAEVRVLMDLKSSLDPEGKILSSWISDGDPCSGSFQGIECNEHGKVANISLQGMGLSGWLSPAVAELKCLSGLYLHYNNLSGEIPTQISNLTDLVDLYLDVNNLSGTIPPEVGNMASLQVLQLGDNQLVGNIPTQLGSLKQLSTLALQYNKLTGQIPLSLGNLEKLSRLILSFNNFSGMIPAALATTAHLEVLDIQNNSLSGNVPSALKRLGQGFQGANNPRLCGVGFSTLRSCNKDKDLDVNHIYTSDQDLSKSSNPPKALPEPANIQLHCNQTHCSKSRRFPHTVITASVITITLSFIGAGFLTFIRYRRQKQRIRNASSSSEGKLSPDQSKEFYSKSPSALANVEYCNGWYPLSDGQNAGGLCNEYLNQFRFNVDEVESATHYLSEANLLGKSKFSAVYKGVLRDGSLVAIRSLSVTCCKTEEAEFVKGLSLLTSLRHENLVRLRGFCCSSGRGECFLIYDFATMGNLSKYLDMEDGSGNVLEWSTRVSIIKGIAKGIGYLHSNEASKPTIVHQNISVENVLLDHEFNPLIMDAGLPKLLADDVVFSALKVSAAMGYLAPEYITTGRFTEKSDIYAFGVIVLQVLSGKKTIGSSIRMAVESFRFDDSIDTNLRGRYSKSEAETLSKLAMLCTHELPDQRPTMADVIQELSVFPAHS
ncbi:LRR receptor kinase BAK1-like [Gastrolobium bilobum]|uniref:LRR receptor kinase BAK1-like n=1 Tax=Gastrolobium bilobum TaxID=150636 RepID=UPI002AB0F692|nr:LRR receptor kinase BAK1-like [Gastrolobium bilobum]